MRQSPHAAAHRTKHRNSRVLGEERSSGALEPFGQPDDADRLLNAFGDGRDDGRPLLGDVLVGGDLRKEQDPERRIAEQRFSAGGEGLRIVEHLSGQIAGVRRRAEVGNTRFEHCAHGWSRLRHRHAERVRVVRRHDGGAPGGRYHRDASGLRPPRFGEELRGLGNLGEVFDRYKSRAPECCGVGLGGARQSPGVGLGRRGGAFRDRHLVDDHGFLGRARPVAEFENASGVADPLEHAGDGAALGLVDEVIGEIEHVDVAGIAGREHMRVAESVAPALDERVGERARLADDADASGWPRELVVSLEHDSRLEQVVDDPKAVGPEDRQAELARADRQPGLFGDPVGLAGFRIARGEHDRAAGAHVRRFADGLLDAFARQGDDHAIGRLGQRGERGETAPVADFLVLGVHQANRPVVLDQIRERAAAEGPRLGRSADEGDRARREQPVEIVAPVERPVHSGCTANSGPSSYSSMMISTSLPMAKSFAPTRRVAIRTPSTRSTSATR